VGDSFNNLRTRLIEYIGNADEATGASKLLSGVINLIAENIGILIDALIVAGAVIIGTVVGKAFVALRASMAVLIAQLQVSATMFQATTNASRTMAMGMAAMVPVANTLRTALAALGGPVGIILSVGTALGVMALGAMDAGESIEDLRAKMDDAEASAESLTATVDEFLERRANRLIGDFSDLNGQTETASERMRRLRQEAEEISLQKFVSELNDADEKIKELEGTVQNLKTLTSAASIRLLGLGEVQEYRAELDRATSSLKQFREDRDRLAQAGPIGFDEASEKKALESVYHSYEVQEFLARNNEQKLIEILTAKVNTVKQLYGEETDEYMRAVLEKEKAEEQFARNAKSAASERSRAERDAQKDALEALDTKIEAAEDDKDESLRLMEEKLTMLQQFYGRDSREYERGLQEKIRMLRRFLAEENALKSNEIEMGEAIARKEAETSYQIAQSGYERKRNLIDMALDQGRIDEIRALELKNQIFQDQIQAQISHEQQILAIKRAAVQAKLALDGLEKGERQRLLDDLLMMDIDFSNKVRALTNQAADHTINTQDQASRAVADSWKQAIRPIAGEFSGMFKSVYNGTMTFRDAFLTVLDNLLFSFVDMGLQMAADWAAMELAKTSATTAGAAARTTAEVTAAGTTNAVSAGAAMGQILNYAWTAAAGAYSAMAGIPIIGPMLAIGVSAAALGAVLAMAGNIFSAEQGFGEVPADGTLTELHKQEMVLPAKFANPLRNMLTGSVGMPITPGTVSATAGERADFFRQTNTAVQEGDTILNYQPVSNVNNVSLETLLRRDGLAMRKWLMNQQRNQPGGRPKKSA
jgi:hypothetical protein